MQVRYPQLHTPTTIPSRTISRSSYVYPLWIQRIRDWKIFGTMGAVFTILAGEVVEDMGLKS